MDNLEPIKYDIAIIGAGPAGLMAACRASELKAKVVLIERNERPGIKLSVTGGGRCNITNYIEDYKLLSANYNYGGKFLLSAFNKFGAKEVVDFFESNGLKTKIEKNNQIFPISNKSQDVIKILTDNITRRNGKILIKETVKNIIVNDNKIEKIILTSGNEIVANNYILATGGKSYPLTGSTGDAYKWLKAMGHNIISPRPALTPIIVREKYIKELEGLSLSSVRLNLYQNNKRTIDLTGDMIFTANGISGPAGLNLSRYIDTLAGNFKIGLDFFPKLTVAELDNNLQKIFAKNGQKNLKNCLLTLLSQKLTSAIINLLGLDEEKKGGIINREERQAISGLLKDWRLTVMALGDYSKAMITAGGLDLKEVDPKNMRSKIISNLFIAGELLDIDGPTGGYNLQVCWSTGYVAGENAAL
jgi:predicted Rossmann fold flavoprotein